MNKDIIKEYFPELNQEQLEQLHVFGEHIQFWNDKINVISRKDIDNVMEHHILHSLYIKRVIRFKEKAKILDLGTGGGFPGIPLAICFPQTKFHLIDARAKKISVVKEAIEKLNLNNVTAEHIRAEELKTKYDFVVTRAVAKLDKLMSWSRSLISEKHQHSIPNGIIALKGGDLKDLRAEIAKHEYIEEFAISDWTDIEYYFEKYVIYVQA